MDHWKDQTSRASEGYGWALPNRKAVYQPRIVGIPEALCSLYSRSERPEDALAVVARYPGARLAIWKATALAQKGHGDAALLIYDDLVRRDQSPTRVADVRYAKALLLLDLGNAGAARRELAQVYAAVPEFVDDANLRVKLDASGPTSARAPIPEAVRHAVWRRDDGRCVQCGSQERLEFDHVIPVSRGGANSERNLQLLCERCNREKRSVFDGARRGRGGLRGARAQRRP